MHTPAPPHTKSIYTLGLSSDFQSCSSTRITIINLKRLKTASIWALAQWGDGGTCKRLYIIHIKRLELPFFCDIWLSEAMVAQPSFPLTAFGTHVLPAGLFLGLDHQVSVLFNNCWGFYWNTSLLGGRRLVYAPLKVNILCHNRA